MNYLVKAYRIVSKNGNTTLEDYEREVPNYFEAKKEMIKLKSLAEVRSTLLKPAHRKAIIRIPIWERRLKQAASILSLTKAQM